MNIVVLGTRTEQAAGNLIKYLTDLHRIVGIESITFAEDQIERVFEWADANGIVQYESFREWDDDDDNHCYAILKKPTDRPDLVVFPIHDVRSHYVIGYASDECIKVKLID